MTGATHEGNDEDTGADSDDITEQRNPGNCSVRTGDQYAGDVERGSGGGAGMTQCRVVCFWNGGRKPEYPERTHTCTGRTLKFHTERPRPGFKPGPLSL